MYNYNYLLNNLPGITVIMIDSGRNEKWLKEAQRSVLNQIYPLKQEGDKLIPQIELKVMINHKRSNTIGFCWNKMINEASFDYISLY